MSVNARALLAAALVVGCASRDYDRPDTMVCEFICDFHCSEGQVWKLRGGQCEACSWSGELPYTCPSGRCKTGRPHALGSVLDPAEFCAATDAGDAPPDTSTDATDGGTGLSDTAAVD